MDEEMALSERDHATLEGEEGPAARMAMRIMAEMLPVLNAKEFLDIEAAHVDSSLYVGPATLAFAERLANLGAQVRVPTTLNVGGVDAHDWRQWSVQPSWAEASRRQMRAYKAMGCHPTWTCAPYQEAVRPKFGQQIGWGESSAVVFANSVLGARTQRYPDFLDICLAITGRAPACGLHLSENRAGSVLFELRNISVPVQQHSNFFPVLGHLIGKEVQGGVPVLDCVDVDVDEDALKAMGAAMASSGSVGLFHMVGVTPEAPTVEAAFQARKPERRVSVTLPMLNAARRELTTAESEMLDLVVLGSRTSPSLSLKGLHQYSVAGSATNG